ncbi:MAG: LysR substrate-binding domain-containing protein [Pseudomonadota bacterium]|nr:LysR substrate-binding domain-containing protein [Pseudomonadota bacterium]
MRYSFRQLEVFAAIGQYGTVSDAADRLSMSQSAASTSLSELELQFDCRLFDRTGKRLRLNEAGRSLLPKARELLDRANEVEAMLAAGTLFGSLRVGATLTIGNYLATLLVGEFMARHPGSRVALEVNNTTRIAERVKDFELDLGLIEGESYDSELEMTDWIADELAVFCGPDHPLVRRRKVNINHVLEEYWIVREPGSGTRQTLDRAMRLWHERWKIRLELEHTEAIMHAVQAGLGIGCVSRLALKESFRRGSLIELKLAELDLSRKFHFLLHRQKYRTPGIDAFLMLCREVSSKAARSDEIVIQRSVF